MVRYVRTCVAVAILMAGAMFLVILVVLLLSPRSLQKLLLRALAFIVIGAWLISNFFYGEYGQLDGGIHAHGSAPCAGAGYRGSAPPSMREAGHRAS